jgi:hypothetical protein
MTKKQIQKKPLKKRVKKKIRKAFKPRNIGKALIIAATAAVLATSILPYIL